MVWKCQPKRVKVPYMKDLSSELSRAEPEKFCLKVPAPSGKAKYS